MKINIKSTLAILIIFASGLGIGATGMYFYSSKPAFKLAGKGIEKNTTEINNDYKNKVYAKKGAIVGTESITEAIVETAQDTIQKKRRKWLIFNNKNKSK